MIEKKGGRGRTGGNGRREFLRIVAAGLHSCAERSRCITAANELCWLLEKRTPTTTNKLVGEKNSNNNILLFLETDGLALEAQHILFLDEVFHIFKSDHIGLIVGFGT